MSKHRAVLDPIPEDSAREADGPAARTESPDRTATLIAWAGIATSVAAILSVALELPAGVRLTSVLAFCCLGPGAAFVAHLRIARAVTAWAMTNALALALWSLGSAVMVWLPLWSPKEMLLAMGLATILGCGVALVGHSDGGWQRG
jgi:hypothetical protein